MDVVVVLVEACSKPGGDCGSHSGEQAKENESACGWRTDKNEQRRMLVEDGTVPVWPALIVRSLIVCISVSGRLRLS